MKVISINVGTPRAVQWKGKVVETGIFKAPVAGPVAVGRTNLAGDRQADLAAHGGVDKAVYAYPGEHYPFWARELGRADLPWGTFGENLTVEGLDEAAVRIGDRLAVGSAEFEVSQPRLPCAKLAMKLDRPDMVSRFLRSGRLGFYLRVLREGVIEAGQAITLLTGPRGAVTIAELALLETTERGNAALLERAVRSSALTESWRRRYGDRLSGLP
jgi:MOSC domain-containing protein YiiM